MDRLFGLILMGKKTVRKNCFNVVFLLVFFVLFTPQFSYAKTNLIQDIWCSASSFFGFPCEGTWEPMEVIAPKVVPPPKTIPTPLYIPQAPVVSTTTTNVTNVYNTHPVTVVYKPAPVVDIASKSDAYKENENSVSLTLFRKQIESLEEDIGDRVNDATDNLAESFTTDALTVSGTLADNNGSIGLNNYILKSTGSGVVWTSTSSLGFASNSDFDTSLELASILSDETGTGNVVFSASPTFTGTALASALTLSSALTMSGSAANIALGSNYLSGDGGDEGVFVDSVGRVAIGTSTTATQELTVWAGSGTNADLYVISQDDNAIMRLSADYNTTALTSNKDPILQLYSGNTFGGELRYDQSLDVLSLSQTNNGNSLSINSAGNVGIGTSTPTALLTVGATNNSQFEVTSAGIVTDGTWQGDVIVSTYLDTAVILSTEIDTSLELAGILTDETGTGNVVFSANPVFSGTITTALIDGCVEVASGVLTSTGANCGVGGGGITAFNGQVNSSQSFASSTSGTDFSITSSGGVHTFRLPSASALNRGLLTSAYFTSFNNRVSTTSIDSLAEIETLTSVSNIIIGEDIDTSAELAILLTDEIGTGNIVFSTNPTFITPNIGVAVATSLNTSGMATSASLTATGLTSAITLTGSNGTFAEYTGTTCVNQFVRSLSAVGVATCATVANTDLANSSVSYGGVSVSLGGSDATPAFDLTDATSLPIATGVSGLGSNVATFLGTPTTANFAGAVTGETGTGALVFGTSPILSSTTISGILKLSSQTASRGLFTDAQSRVTTTALSATLLNSLTDETGTGVAVFSASPTFTGTTLASALTLSSTLTLSGSSANIVLGSNYLSGDGGDEGVFVDGSGNVGIGTSSPLGRFDVGGHIAANLSGIVPIVNVSDNLNNISGVRMSNVNSGTSADFRFLISDSTGHYFAFAQPGLNNNGSTLFGAARASTDFIFNNGGTGRTIAIGTLSANNLILGTNSIARMTILSGGNVGIGTSTPAEELTVTGDLRLTGRIYDSANSAGTNGMVLKSTGTGQTWVATSTLGFASTNDFNTSAELASILTDETGTGVAVFSASPTFTGTPVLPSTFTIGANNFIRSGAHSLTLTTTGTTNVTLPSSGTLYSTETGSFTSLNLSTSVTNETGSGALVFGTSPTLSSTTISGILKLSSQTASRGLFTDAQSRATTTALSATLLNSLTDETGTGVAVFNASPTFTGTVLASAATLSSTLTLSGSSANIVLGSNYLSGDGGDEGIYVGSTGNVGIGITSPSYSLHIQGSSSTTAAVGIRNSTAGASAGMYIDDSAIFHLGQPGATQRLSINLSTGNVGIGTTSPSQELTVTGDFRLTGRIYDTLNSAGTNGMVLKSTGTGQTWVATSTLGFASTNDFNTSAELLAILNDETGTGVAVFGTSPSITTAINPVSDGGADLGTAALSWDDLFLDTGATINFDNGNSVITHSSGILTVSTGDLRVTTAGTNAASVVTVGGTQTLTSKTLTAPSISAPTLSGVIVLSGQTTSRALFVDPSSRATTTALSAYLLNSLTDETGTGVAVFSISPTFTGTVLASAATLSSTLTLSGSAANIALGSNYLSGDGGDEGVFVDSSGFVGIGTSTPGNVNSLARSLVLQSSGNGGITIIGGSGAGANSTIAFGDPANSIIGSIRYSHSSSGIGGADAMGFFVSDTATPRMVINSSGNIGIGTTTPTQKLHISNTTANGSVGTLLLIDSATQNAGVAGSGAVIAFDALGAGTAGYGAVGGYGNGTLAGMGLWGGTSTGAPDLFLTSAGNVGIGTTTPGGLLTVGATNGSQFEVTSLGAVTDGSWTADNIAVAYGGTGAATFTDGGVLLGSGTGAITAMAVLGNGAIIVGDGTTDPVALTAFTSSTGDVRHEAGGLEADVSAYTNGLYGMIASVTTDIDTEAELESALGSIDITDSTDIDTCAELIALVGAYETGTCGNLVFSTSPTLTTPVLGVATATTLDTGQGANELYDMNQNVQTTDVVTFGQLTVSGASAGVIMGDRDGAGSFQWYDSGDILRLYNGTTDILTIASATGNLQIDGTLTSDGAITEAGSAVISAGDIDTCAELIALAGAYDTGTCGNLVFSVSPTFTGTVQGSALTLSSTLTMSGVTANIALGSNWLSGDGGDEGVFVDSTGEVGIGTTTPLKQLHVWSGTTAENTQLESFDTTAYSATAYQATNRLTLKGGNATNAHNLIRFTAGSGHEAFFGTVQNASGYGEFVWKSWGGAYTEKMRITSDGDVGIGVSSPLAKLDISSAAATQFTPTLSVRGTAGGTTNGIEWGHVNSAGYGSTLGHYSSAGNPYIAFNGQAGTTANTFRTQGLRSSIILSDLAGGMQFGNVATAAATDNQAFVPTMVLTSAGNLQVDGTLEIDGTTFITAGAAETYGSVTVDGSKNAYSGFNFADVTNGADTLMFHNSTNIQGAFNTGSSTWSWYFDDGVLSAGSVPVGRITGTLTVANGGTGATTLTDGGVLLGSGTGAITAMAVLADGAIIVGDGTTDPVALTAFTSSTGDVRHEAGGLEADVSAYTGLLAISGGATSEVDSAAEFVAQIADITTVTGTTNLVLSASPTLTGTVLASAATLSSTLTMSGAAANIALGSNYLSGDGGDEGVYVHSNGRVSVGSAVSTGAMFDVAGTVRATADVFATAGTGVSLFYNGGGYVSSYDHTGGARTPMIVQGSDVTLSGDSESVYLVGSSVGIGDFNPTEAKLVIGASGANNIYLTLDTGGTTNNAVCWDNSGATLLYDCDATPADYAESYPTETNVQFGHIVMNTEDVVTTKIGTNVSKLAKAERNQGRIMGITSDNYHDFTSAGKEEIAPQHHPLPVALVGRVPVKINLEGGEIAVGDPITISSVAGIGTKATTSGSFTIGTALESYTEDDEENNKDTVLVFVANGTFETQADIQRQQLFAQTLTDDTDTFNLLLDNQPDTIWTRLTTLAQGFVDGVLQVAGVRTEELCVTDENGSTCIDRGQLNALLQNANNNQGGNNGGGEDNDPVDVIEDEDDNTTGSSTDPVVLPDDTTGSSSDPIIIPEDNSGDVTPSSTDDGGGE